MLRRLLLLITTLFGCLAAQSQWQANGIALRQGVHIEWQRTATEGEDGAAVFVWSDVRNGIRDVYAQKVDTSGTLLWGVAGLTVTNAPGRQEDPVAISDGAGGAFIVPWR